MSIHLSDQEAYPKLTNPLDATFLSRWTRTSTWDEMIYPLDSSDRNLTTANNFLYLSRPKRITVLDYIQKNASQEDFNRDLAAFVAGNEAKDIVIEVYGFSPGTFHPSPQQLEALGFTQSRGGAAGKIRCRNLVAESNTCGQVPLPPGFSIIQVTPTHPDWPNRIQFETTLFSYSPAHIEWFNLQLSVLSDLGADEHFIIKEDSSGDCVGYLTMRYRYGLAYVQGAGVSERFRRKGFTRHLVEEYGIKRAKERGYEMVVVIGWSNEADRAWGAMGFDEVEGAQTSSWTKKVAK
ncbi:hypothetical protein HDU79_006402 [Rhizoclosmatium sp. JEL0117]|nr:hypothetical protein HDU79_006402 [Rhizoclosmatium sp. JEL0117]